jgi:hypothetical protein
MDFIFEWAPWVAAVWFLIALAGWLFILGASRLNRYRDQKHRLERWVAGTGTQGKEG